MAEKRHLSLSSEDTEAIHFLKKVKSGAGKHQSLYQEETP